MFVTLFHTRNLNSSISFTFLSFNCLRSQALNRFLSTTTSSTLTLNHISNREANKQFVTIRGVISRIRCSCSWHEEWGRKSSFTRWNNFHSYIEDDRTCWNNHQPAQLRLELIIIRFTSIFFHMRKSHKTHEKSLINLLKSIAMNSFMT